MVSTPRRLLNYALLRELGRGGMATVWYAENSVGRRFAVKLLRPELVVEESSVAERFRKEAQIMVRLEHPAILRVEDFYEDGPTRAIIMEYLAGHDLNQHVVQQGAIPESQVVSWFMQVLDAFSYVHQKGYFHRDVKPSNLFLTDSGAIKVMDFGIAKIVGTDLSLTQTDVLMGSPLYMSPEQITSPKTIDFRTDIYSLGVTLHALLSGKKPYNDAERSMFSIQTDIVQQPLSDLPHVSRRVNAVIQRATQKNPADRFANCDEFKRALITPEPTSPTDDATVLHRPGDTLDSETRQMPVPTLETDTVLTSRQPVVSTALRFPAGTDRPVVSSNNANVKSALTRPELPKPAPAAMPSGGERKTAITASTGSKAAMLVAIVIGVIGSLVGGWFWWRQQTMPGGKSVPPMAQSSVLGSVPPSTTAPDADKSIQADITRGLAFYKQNRFDSALALLTRHEQEPAFLTNAEAITDLGVIYFFGAAEQRVPQNLAVAENWLQQGVAARNAKAAYYLGLLRDGVNFTTVTKACGRSQPVVDLYESAAAGGDAYAKMTLGELFLARNAFVRDEDPCRIKTYLQQAVADNVPEAGVALKSLQQRGYCP